MNFSPKQWLSIMDSYKYSDGGDQANNANSQPDAPYLDAEAYRAKLKEQKEERWRKYLEFLDRDGFIDAEATMHALFKWHYIDDEQRECNCACHPRLGDSDLHGYGFDCQCQLTAEERKARWSNFWDVFSNDENDPWVVADKQAWDEVDAWLMDHPEVVVTERGGAAPEQWEGTIDGHSFYFRERHGDWRIELDLVPSGHFYKRLKLKEVNSPVDMESEDDGAHYEEVETTEGEVIARGVEGDYGDSHLDVLKFIVKTVRDHLRRSFCEHDWPPDPKRYCAECGTQLVFDEL